MGSKIFTKNIHEKYLNNKTLSPEIPQQKHLQPAINPKQIIQTVAKYYGANEISLKTVKRKASNKPRQVAIYLTIKLSKKKYKYIAEEFTGTTSAGIAKTFQRTATQIITDSQLNKEIILLEDILMSFVKT